MRCCYDMQIHLVSTFSMLIDTLICCNNYTIMCIWKLNFKSLYIVGLADIFLYFRKFYIHESAKLKSRLLLFKLTFWNSVYIFYYDRQTQHSYFFLNLTFNKHVVVYILVISMMRNDFYQHKLLRFLTFLHMKTK